MKIKVTNFELDRYMAIINSEKSFRNNIEIKLPGGLSWALRVNLKAFSDRFELYNIARQDVVQEFIKAGKVENDRVKEEYLKEFNTRMTELAVQVNEFDVDPINENDVKSIPLSMPELDFLMIMVEPKTEPNNE